MAMTSENPDFFANLMDTLEVERMDVLLLKSQGIVTCKVRWILNGNLSDQAAMRRYFVKF